MKNRYDQVFKNNCCQTRSEHKSNQKLRSGLIMLVFILLVATSFSQDCGTGDTITFDVNTNIGGVFTVATDDVLQILPGVNINFETQDSKLSIEGTILAEGTEASPITFSGLLADGWSGLDLTNACPSKFVYCNFSGINRGGNKLGDSRAVAGIEISATDDVIFEHCTFTGNSDGIGIANSTGVLISSCNFIDNEILPGQKGLIYIEGGSSDTIRDCEFRNNKTNLRGIISVNNGSTAVIQNNEFVQTLFFEPVFNGTIFSVINLKQSDAPNLLIVNGNDFRNSKAPEGNRLCEISVFGNQNNIDNSNVLIWNNSFIGYPFPTPGQTPKTAIRANYSVLTITHNTIRFYNRSGIELLVSEAKINLNTIASNSTTFGVVNLDEYSGYAGRVINNVIFANTFTNNSASSGPAILSKILPNENVITTIEQNLFSQNAASDDGGKGGAIYDFYGSRMNIINNVFDQNSADHGGAICIETNAVEESVSALVKNNQFTGNTASGSGGAVYAERSMISFENNEIKDNQAPNGGGIYLDGSENELKNTHRAELNFTDNIFSNNTYGQAGGGCYLLNCQDIEFVRNLFSSNIPDGTPNDQFGGGIYAENSNLNLYNCNFVENEASADFGAIYLNIGLENTLVVQNCNLTGHQDAGGVVIENIVNAGDIAVFNTLFYENNQGATGKAFIYNGPDPIDLYNCYFDVLPAGFDLNFVDELVNGSPGWAEFGSYYLDCVNSICVDSGNPDTAYNDLPGANPDEALFPSCGTLTNDIGISGGPYALDISELFQPEVVETEILITNLEDNNPEENIISDNPQEDLALSVYPNPTHGLITISTNLRNAETAEMILADAFGRIIMQKKNSGFMFETNFDLTGRPAGLYVLRLISGNQIYTETILLK